MADEQPPERNVNIESTVNVGTATDQTTVSGTNVSVGSAREVHVHSAPAAPLQPALHQLRAPVGDFVGREQEIAKLVQALTKTSSATAAISGVRGMGGIGKTELAYAAAQRLAGHFPDAQLLIELRGASANPLTPEAALQTAIRAFERKVKLPGDLGQLQALYRDKLTGKKVLILADDAKDAAQVRPLLPPAGCALLVTSRNRFSLPGMATVDLGTLPKESEWRNPLQIPHRAGSQSKRLARPVLFRQDADFEQFAVAYK